MSREAVLGLGMRKRLYATIQSYPGLHVRELARQLETSVALVEYHLAVLQQNGIVQLVREEGFLRAFAKGTVPSKGDRKWFSVLRGKIPLSIALLLLDNDEPVRHKTMAETLGLAPSKLSFHLRKLEDAGVVRRTSGGEFEPVDRPALFQHLLENEPTPDAKKEFADLWLALYGKKKA